MTDFVHLHLHTEYSLLDGACRIADMMDYAKSLGQTAVAITDHGVMYGVVEFYNAAKKDRAEAWERYCRLCRAGGSLGYFQLLELAGLHNPFLPDTVINAVTEVAKDLGL